MGTDLKHLLGRIILRPKLRATISLEVLSQNMRILSHTSKIHGLPPFCKKEQTIEFLEQNGGRLVDSAKDGLAVVCELAEESKDGPGSLGVQTGGRLVKE